jgi:tetratricopeptide (TPR) repeat protein
LRWACRALLADLYRESHDTERANALQAHADDEAPDTAEAWYLRSFATIHIDEAARCAQKAVDRDPVNTLAWHRLTDLRLKLDDFDGALQGADRLIGLGADVPTWTLFRGRVLARQGRTEEAIGAFTRAGSLLDRAHAYRRVGEWAKAVEDYTRVIEGRGLQGAGVWYLYQRATPLWILGRTEEALEDYRQVRVLLGRPFYSDARRALILHELGRPEEAQAVLDAAIRESPPSWLRRILRGLRGDLTPEQLVGAPGPAEDPEKLCEAYYYAGEACLLRDKPAEAREWFQKCAETGMRFDPDTMLGTPMNEYELARWRLSSFPSPPTAPSGPTSAPASEPHDPTSPPEKD